MKEIKLKFTLPFKRNLREEDERVERLNNKTVSILSPYINVIIVVDGEEITKAIACIQLQKLNEEEITALPINIWDHAEHLTDPRSGREDQVANVEYDASDKKITFLWRNMKTNQVYSCFIEIDLGI